MAARALRLHGTLLHLHLYLVLPLLRLRQDCWEGRRLLHPLRPGRPLPHRQLCPPSSRSAEDPRPERHLWLLRHRHPGESLLRTLWDLPGCPGGRRPGLDGTVHVARLDRSNVRFTSWWLLRSGRWIDLMLNFNIFDWKLTIVMTLLCLFYWYYSIYWF